MSLSYKEIQELIKLVNKSNLTEFKMKDGEFQLSIRTKKFGKVRSQQIIQPQQQIVPVQTPMAPMQVPAAVPASAPAKAKPAEAAAENGGNTADEENYLEVKSPMVGTFYRSPSPDKPSYIKPGQQIEVGDVVCIVEAMKLFNEIESEVSGRIVDILVEDASPVEYDQVLFRVDPNG